MGVNLSRRKFLWTTGIVGGGLVVGFSLIRSGGEPPPISRSAGDFVPDAFLQITAENVVRFYCPRDEMGQRVTTGLATLVAEELDVAPHHIEVALAGVHGDYANPEFGVQATGGSTSIKAHYLPLREAAKTRRAGSRRASSATRAAPIPPLAPTTSAWRSCGCGSDMARN